MLNLNRIAAVILAMTCSSPVIAQYDVYENLAFVPRQGHFSMVMRMSAEGISSRPTPSVFEIASAFEARSKSICENNKDGVIVNWFGKVRSVTGKGSDVFAELIVAENASLLARLNADTEFAEQFKATEGRWIRFDGKFTPGARCLSQVPPMTVLASKRPLFIGSVSAIYDTVTDEEERLLEIALPLEVWTDAIE